MELLLSSASMNGINLFTCIFSLIQELMRYSNYRHLFEWIQKPISCWVGLTWQGGSTRSSPGARLQKYPPVLEGQQNGSV